MAIAPETGDTPSVSAPEQPSDSPPAESQSHAMEVDDEQGDPPPASPISPVDDDLLTDMGVADIEGDLANLMVSSPKNPDGGGQMPPPRRLLSTYLFGRHSWRVPPGRLWEGSEATVMDRRRWPRNLLRNQPDGRERDDQPEETPDGPLIKANFVNS